MDIQPYQFKSVTHDKPLPSVKAVIKSTKDNANNVSRAIQKPVKDAYKAVDNIKKGAQDTANNAVKQAKGIGDDVSKNVANTGNALINAIKGCLSGFWTNLKSGVGTLGKDFTAIIGVLTVVAILFAIKFFKDIFD